MKILIGIDGSEGGWEALQQAAALAPPDAELVLYYAPPKVHFVGAKKTRQLTEQAEHSLAKAIFDEARRRLPPSTGKVTCLEGTHNPRQGLVLAAEQVNADLVAVGAHGLSTTRLMLGSVTRSLLRQTKRPLLVARPTPLKKKNTAYRVLWAVDETPAVRAPVEFLESLAWPAGSEGTVIHIVDPLVGMEVPPWFAEKVGHDEEFSRRFSEEYAADKQRKFNEMAGFAAELPRPFGSLPILVEGNVAKTILAKATEEGADLVIIGTRDLGAVQRLILGSAAENVLHFAPCSVLVVHMPTKP